VQPEELRSAVRWRIKDLIDFHIDDAVIDVFEVPGQHSTGAGGRLMYAVAARATAVQSSIRRLEDAGMDLRCIDIPEMCLRNVAALLPQDVVGVAFMYLGRDDGFIVLTRQGTLYLARRIETGYAALAAANPEQFDTLASGIVLELQRSLDYYESHYAQASIGHITLAPTVVPLPGLQEFIQSHVSARVNACDLNELLDVAVPCDQALQGHCLPALGAALRAEAAAAL
jgi:MSHA biogenesis protein MshI